MLTSSFSPLPRHPGERSSHCPVLPMSPLTLIFKLATRCCHLDDTIETFPRSVRFVVKFIFARPSYGVVNSLAIHYFRILQYFSCSYATLQFSVHKFDNWTVCFICTYCINMSPCVLSSAVKLHSLNTLKKQLCFYGFLLF